MSQMWTDEQLKAVFYFDNELTCEASMDSKSNNIILYAEKDAVEQTNYSNLFGSITPNTLHIKIISGNNELDMNSVDSPYYGYMRNGVKIELFITYDDITWDKYGTYYVTEWKNSFFDGLQDIVDIVAVDELQYILNNDIPELPAYSGIKAGELIKSVLKGCGIDNSRIKISDDIRHEIRFGVTEDCKVGYFLNEVCQALCAVIIIDDDSDILIMPALSGYNNKYDLDAKYIEKIQSSNNVNSIYTDVICRYEHVTGNIFGDIVNDVVEINNPVTDINNLQFNGKALSIAEISLSSDEFNDNTNIRINSFSGYQGGIDIDINSDTDMNSINLCITGKYLTSTSKKVSSRINYRNYNYRDSYKKVSYEMYNKYVQSNDDASEIADKMARYIALMDNKITLDTLYSPRITIGDIITFDNEFLQGKFKVIASKTIFGTTYEKILTIIPLRTYAVWDDSQSWEDSYLWMENNNLSLQ